MEIIVILLMAIFGVLLYIAYLLYHLLYRIAKNQKVGFETIYDLIKEKK